MARPKKRPPNRADGRYEIKRSFKKLTGSDKKKSFYSTVSFEDCERQAKEYEALLMAHELVGETLISKEIGFDEWAKKWLSIYKEGKVKDNTYQESYKRTVESYLIPYFGNTPLQSIKQLHIAELVKKHKDTYSDTVMKKMRLCLNGIFETAIENDLCRKNPVKNVPFDSNVVSEEKKTYTQSQVDEIYKFCDIHKSGIYIRILLELGLRCSELCGLQWNDIDFETKTIYIRTTSTQVNNKAYIDKTKTVSSARDLPLSTDLLNMLKKHKEQGNGVSYVLQSKMNMPYTPANFTKALYNRFFIAFEKYLVEENKKRKEENPKAKDVIIPRLSPHELRHTCGTLLYARTKDIFAVSKYLGHASLDITTKRYVHDSADLLRTNLGIK